MRASHQHDQDSDHKDQHWWQRWHITESSLAAFLPCGPTCHAGADSKQCECGAKVHRIKQNSSSHIAGDVIFFRRGSSSLSAFSARTICSLDAEGRIGHKIIPEFN
jgi:hypothetical protein